MLYVIGKKIQKYIEQKFLLKVYDLLMSSMFTVASSNFYSIQFSLWVTFGFFLAAQKNGWKNHELFFSTFVSQIVQVSACFLEYTFTMTTGSNPIIYKITDLSLRGFNLCAPKHLVPSMQFVQQTMICILSAGKKRHLAYLCTSHLPKFTEMGRHVLLFHYRLIFIVTCSHSNGYLQK